ncbi:GntR family transcriptional regulator [Nonomuraea rubra]|uniref:DNA-binding GntR family transcriptional regulator n=1 Tax=Nonomuraea rubra TaxID=46180 RepID=A0A7X0U627_9ACTN|nr:UTRA domain-containing protein [Nonomuraea rubra]MBB6556095.1 DNA-binding GntR family transcriptional regulator [Nonomuraea rubra]
MEDSTWTNVSADYVRPQQSGEADAWTTEAATQGGVGSNELREVAQVQPPTAIARALGLSEAEPAIVRRRLVLLDGTPVELADSFYPLQVAAGTPLAEPRKVRGGAVTLLAELGFLPRRVVETVRSRPATDEERDLLNLGPHDWVLVLSRVTHAGDDRPFEATVMTMVAAGRELRYEMTI